MNKLVKKSSAGLKPEDFDQYYKNYTDIVREIIKDYHISTMKPSPDDVRLTEITDVWTAHLIRERVRMEKLEALYLRAMKKSDYLTIPLLLQTWSQMQEEAANNKELVPKRIDCTICKGTGIGIKYNFITGEDEELPCICRN